MINTKNDINNNQSIPIYLLVLFYVSILLLPTNLFLVWRVPESFLSGHFIDYLAPKIYLSQIIIGALGGVWALKMQIATRGRALLSSFFRTFSWKRHISSLSLFLIVLILLIQAVRWQDTGLLSLVANFIIGPVFIGIFLWKERSLLRLHFLRAVGITTTLQAILGLIQWLRQDSLFGYWFFGEPNLRLPEITTSSLPGTVQILPYGTTPHPNILAGWLVVGILCLLHLWQAKRHEGIETWMHIVFFGVLALHFFTLLLTESWGAGITLLLLFAFSHLLPWLSKTLKRLKPFHQISFMAGVFGLFLLLQGIWLIVPQVLSDSSFFPGVLERTSFTRRAQLQTVSVDLLRTEPSGSGFRRIFQRILDEENTYIGGRFLQPPHNFWILLLTVGGYWILIVFFFYIVFEHNKYSIISLLFLCSLPIFTLDHYIISTISGQFISVLLLYYISQYKYKESL